MTKLNMKEYDRIHKECRDIAVKKNTDYGHSGLVEFGELGLALRLNDKMQRLKHLIARNKKSKVIDESLQDTAQDMINYSTYLIMMLNKKLIKK